MLTKTVIEKLQNIKRDICINCMHPQMVGWCEEECQYQEALEKAIEMIKSEEE